MGGAIDRRRPPCGNTSRGKPGGMPQRSYLAVLGGAVLCYAALGCVLRVLTALVDDRVALELLVGAPALAAIITRPLGGQSADRLCPAPVMFAAAAAMAAGVLPALVST